MWSTSINDEINVQKATLQIRAWVEMLISWVKNTRDERNPMQACTRLSEIARNTCDSENFDLNTMWSPTKAADAMASVRISLACFMVMFLALYGTFSKFYEHILGCRMPPDCCLFSQICFVFKESWKCTFEYYYNKISELIILCCFFICNPHSRSFGFRWIKF